MCNPGTLVVLGISSLHVLAAAQQGVTPVAVVGSTQPLALSDQGASATPSPTPQARKEQARQAVHTLKQGLQQVHTEALTPGQVTPHSLPQRLGLSQPIAVVGCDPYSWRWLAHYQTRLAQLHPLVLVVNCRGEQDLHILQQISGQQGMPVRGNALARRFGLHHYPVLISQQYISQ